MVLFLILFLGIPYLIAFALLAFLPGWRSLLLFSAAAFLLCWWSINDTSANGDGPGLLLALGLLLFMSLGFFAGFLARTIVLVGRAFGWARASRTVLVLPFVLIAIPVATVAYEWGRHAWHKARHAPPSLACAESTHAAKLGNVTLDIPIAPVISVGTGPEYERTYIFNINQHAREFCEEAISSPPSLTRISFDLSSYGLARMNFAFCTKPRPYAWWGAVCQRDERQLVDYPAKTTVYVIGEHNASKMHARSAESSTRYRSKMAGLPTKSFGNGTVTQHIGQHRSYFTRSDSEEYVAECFTSERPDGRDLYCSTGYALSEGLGLIYDFHTSADQFAEQSMRIDQAARAMFQGLVRS